MILFAAVVLGVALGWYRATRAGGDIKDKLQYAAAHALAFSIIGLFVTIYILRQG